MQDACEMRCLLPHVRVHARWLFVSWWGAQQDGGSHEVRMATRGEKCPCKVRMAMWGEKWLHKVKMSTQGENGHTRWEMAMWGESAHARWEKPHEVKMSMQFENGHTRLQMAMWSENAHLRWELPHKVRNGHASHLVKFFIPRYFQKNSCSFWKLWQAIQAHG